MELPERAEGEDFAEVYQAYLAPLWRYVRSRVWGYHDSQDVTAEVFAKAWQSWPSYNPSRGGVAPWLFRIAQRTVADWHRRHRSEASHSSEPRSLEEVAPTVLQGLDAALLDQEMLTDLGWALAQLSDRDRNCVALRFAGGLKMAEVAEVLGMSTGAVKMVLSRALKRLAELIRQLEEKRVTVTKPPAALDDIIDELIVRGHPMSSDRLQELMVHISALHQPSVPPELPARLAACIACATKFRAVDDAHSQARPRRPWLARAADALRLAPLTGVGWMALAPICLACTIPVLIVPFLAVGMSVGLSFGLHLIALATAPLVFVVLWRHFRRHRDTLGVRVGAVGALALSVHFGLHVIPGAEAGAPTLFTISDQFGTGVLLVGAFIDWRAMRRWMSDQRTRLEALAPAHTSSA
jgi:RNA polymerase sigma-70 factor (ECF subfamily)